MKYALFALALVVLAAGCTGQTIPDFGKLSTDDAKNLQEIQNFLEDYPNAEIKTAIYDSDSIKAVLPEFKEDCPTLGNEGKTYSKITARDPDTNRGLIVWTDNSNNVVCSVIKPLVTQTTTSTLVKRPDGGDCTNGGECTSGFCINRICNTPGAIATTSSTSTTTSSTTTSTTTTVSTTTQPTTTTANTTTTSTTTSTTTTTTLPQLPDLTGIANVYKYTGGSPGIAVKTNITITNIGNIASNTTYVQAYITNASSNVNIFGFGTSISSLSPGNSTNISFSPQYNTNWTYYKIFVVIDWYNVNTEITKSNNNISSNNFPIPFP